MAKRAPNVNVQAALVDMAQTWERLDYLVTADQMAFSFTELREKSPKAVPIGRVGFSAE
jgi:hypothetical protein